MSGTFNYEGTDLEDFFKLTIIQRIQKILPIAINKSFERSINYLENEYIQKKQFLCALEFSEFNIPEILKTPKDGLGYPLLELESILERSVYLAYSSFYKEAIISLRSVLELSLVIARFYTKQDKIDISNDFEKYFEEKDIILDEIINWLKSKTTTPQKSEFINYFINEENFKDLANSTKWKHDFNNIWDELCNYNHSNGIRYMSLNLHSNIPNLNYPPEFEKGALSLFFDSYIKVVQQVAIISVTMRPELLNEEMAYQIEIQIKEPLIGTGLWGGAIDIFFELIPDEYKKYFEKFRVKISE